MRKLRAFFRFFSACLALQVLLAAIPVVRASDHADPLVLNPLRPPKVLEPRITDLHVFLDRDQDPSLPEATALVLSFCVFPSMPPLTPLADGETKADAVQSIEPPGEVKRYRLAQSIPGLHLESYSFRVSIDLHTKLSFSNAGDLARYGATFVDPTDIAPEVVFEFHLNDDGSLQGDVEITGIKRGHVVTNGPFQPSAINIATGVFDDPFIFPRFFRTNVIAIVVSIPLDRFRPDERNFVVWATSSKDGRQIDHVGRSQRTQLPRFDYLNTLPPNEHVAAINRHHVKPDLSWDFMRTFLSPLFGRRPYDSVPDVAVFNSDRPTLFPNGRKLDDDVAAILKDTGDTQLWEACFTDDSRYPRATMNDGEFDAEANAEVSRKPFLSQFPYLASPWTRDEVAKYPLPFKRSGSVNLEDSSWRTLWRVEIAAILILAGLLAVTVRSKVTRVVVVLAAVIALFLIHAVSAPNLPASDLRARSQPGEKLVLVLLGGGFIGVFGVALIFALGRRSCLRYREPEPFPPGNQDSGEHDLPTATHSYDEVKAAVFKDPYYGDVWGVTGQRPLPVYEQTVGSLVRGLFPLGKRLFLQAVKRSVRSRADLRWGPDGKGFRRLLHPMGICLTGTWKITGAPPGTNYTGFFANGAEGRIIGRYSVGGSKPWGGNYRSLSLVGKIYLKDSGGQIPTKGPAHFFTQEDLGSVRTNSIHEAILTNSPPVSAWNRRGRDFVFLIINGLTLLKGDTQNTERQLYEIAELGKPEHIPTSCPRFMRLTVSKTTPHYGVEGADFRDEILGIIYDRGKQKPQRKLIFDIAVSDSGRKWKFGAEFLTGQNWTKIGEIVFEDAAVSYNGDFVIHFHHPAWRNDRNDPKSIKRHDLR